MSFNPKKCEFFKKRIEWIGHDIITRGNCPDQSKFNMLTDWPQPTTGESLSSFNGLVTFYSKYIPWFETDIQPLRALQRKYHRQPIPLIQWTPTLSALFLQFKHAITNDPCLARYDSNMPCFLKTDWSARGMSYIVMQPDTDQRATAALKILKEGGENHFNT